jgi:hypothetical protein
MDPSNNSEEILTGFVGSFTLISVSEFKEGPARTRRRTIESVSGGVSSESEEEEEVEEAEGDGERSSFGVLMLGVFLPDSEASAFLCNMMDDRGLLCNFKEKF